MADFKQLIAQAVKKYNLPPEWADIGHRQMVAESGGNPTAVSPAGAQGLMQFMPKTAKGYGLQNPNDPAQAIDAWGRMTADLVKQTGGNPAHVLAAYNWGIGNLNKQGMGKAPKETLDYIAKIMGSVPLGGGRVAQANTVYKPGPVANAIGGADYHQALEDHAQPGTPPQDDRMATPRFDMANYAPQTYTPDAPLDAYSPEEIA